MPPAYSEASGGGTAGTRYDVTIVVINDPTGSGSGTGSFDPPSNPGTGDVSISGERKKWHKITLSFDGPAYDENASSPNPHLDYRLDVTFTNGSKSYIIPGYFAADGDAAETSATEGNVWKVHFSPDETGTWNYTCTFRIGENMAVSDMINAGTAVPPIDGKTGSFSVAEIDKAGLDLRAKGRLSYVGEHYLKFEETGEYFVKGGPDAPENFLAYEDFDNTPDHGDRLKSWAPHQQDYETGDPSWQSGKGTEIIGTINYLANEGLNVFSFLTMNINGDDENVYPYISDSDYKHFDVSKLDQWAIVFDHDPYHHNIVIHTYPGQQEDIYTPMLGTNSKLTGVSIQTSWNNVHSETKKWVNESSAAGVKWIVANDEQGSANIGVPHDDYTGTPDKHEIRKQTLWGNLIAGGAGVEYYFGYSLPESDLSCEDFRSRDESWDYVRYALNFFREHIPFGQMRPNDALVSTGWCLADEGNTYLIYLPDGGSSNLTISQTGTYSVKWFDPRNSGALMDGSVTSISGTGTQSLGTPPNNPTSDWAILVVNSEGINLAPHAEIMSNKTSGDAPLTIDFDGSGSTDSDGSIASYSWDFGDGGSATGAIVSHTFNTSGNYSVILTVTDDDGKESSSTEFISVTEEPSSSCDGASHEEKNGMVVVEIESVSPASGWTQENSVTGYTGESYFRWTGGDRFNPPGSGTLTYKIKINTPGKYRFQWRSKVGHGTNSTEANDSWLKIPDADDFYGVQGGDIVRPKGICTNDCPEGAGSNGWFKVYLSGTTN